MKKFGKLLLVISALCFTIFNCTTEDETNKIELIIKGNYNNNPLVFAPGFQYDYFEGSKISFTRSEFFLNNFKLVSKNGTIVDFGTLQHIKLQDYQYNLDKANQGVKLIFETDAVGDFDALRFDLGLTQELNATNPSNYRTGHILAEGDNYWSGWNSYIFSKTEGSLSDQQGKSVLFAYHSGFNNALRHIDISKNIQIKPDVLNSITIELDHSKIFGTKTDYVDIYKDNIIHEGTDFINKFMDQFSKSFY
ncbi:MAG: hypothetical protein IT267_03825 [Saprospiraceae bacterium]|nr:hypothetical protein [Saprospiraceae bacterium]